MGNDRGASVQESARRQSSWRTPVKIGTSDTARAEVSGSAFSAAAWASAGATRRLRLVFLFRVLGFGFFGSGFAFLAFRLVGFRFCAVVLEVGHVPAVALELETRRAHQLVEGRPAAFGAVGKSWIAHFLQVFVFKP